MPNYDDIINFPHYEPKNHPRMSITSRSAQFAPFSALTGFKEEISEKGRLVDKKKILSEEQKEEIDYLLNYLEGHINDNIKIKLTYFEKDDLKNGGRYLKEETYIKKIDHYHQRIILCDLKRIKISDLYKIELVDELEDFNI